MGATTAPAPGLGDETGPQGKVRPFGIFLGEIPILKVKFLVLQISLGQKFFFNSINRVFYLHFSISNTNHELSNSAEVRQHKDV